jgi:hypothetical protein
MHKTYRGRVALPLLLLSLFSGVALVGSGCSRSQPSTPAAAAPTPTTGSTAGSGGVDYLAALLKARGKAQEIETSNNLKRIALAMHIWHDTYERFPTQTGDPKGQSKLSWRVHILPFIEQQDLYKQFKLDEPWDSPANKPLLEKMPNIYRNPRFQTKEEKPTTTYFLGIVGDGGIFSVPGGATLTAITNANGSSNTIMVVEAGTAVPWTKPEDYPHDRKKPLPPLGGPKPGATFLAAFADGHVQPIPIKYDEKMLRCMMQWDNTLPVRLP